MSETRVAYVPHKGGMDNLLAPIEIIAETLPALASRLGICPNERMFDLVQESERPNRSRAGAACNLVRDVLGGRARRVGLRYVGAQHRDADRMGCQLARHLLVHATRHGLPQRDFLALGVLASDGHSILNIHPETALDLVAWLHQWCDARTAETFEGQLAILPNFVRGSLAASKAESEARRLRQRGLKPVFASTLSQAFAALQDDQSSRRMPESSRMVDER